MSDEAPENSPLPLPTPPSARRRASGNRGKKAETQALVAPPVPPADKADAIRPPLAHEMKLAQIGGQDISRKSDADIKQWADRQGLEALPEAIAELRFNLRYGTDKQRETAMMAVLDMHGLRKREAAAGNHATIVLNLGGDKASLAQKLPWLSRSDQASETEGDE